MKQLGHPQDRKRIGLRPVQYGFMLEHRSKIGYSKRDLFLQNHRIGNGKKGRKADPCNQQAVKAGAGQTSSRKQALFGIPGRPFHQAVGIIIIHSERQCRKGIGNQVNPKDMAGFQGRCQAAQNRQEHGHYFSQVGGKKENDGFLNIFVNPPPFHNGFFYGSEIIVCEYNIRSLLGHIRSCHPHGNADIRRFEGRRVVDAVACHSHNIPLFLKTFYNTYLVFRGNPGKYPYRIQFVQETFLIQTGNRISGEALLRTVHYPQLLPDGEGGIHMIAGDHHGGYPCIPETCHRIGSFGTRRILHPHHPYKGKPFFHRPAAAGPHGNRQRTQGLGGHVLHRLSDLPSLLLRHGCGPAV